MKFVVVKLLPNNREFRAKKGENLLQLLRKNEIYLPSSCGGHGICGKCLVRVSNSNGLEWEYVNACQVSVNENLIVDLSHSSVYLSSPETSISIKKEYRIAGTYNINPNINNRFIRLRKDIERDYLSQIYYHTGVRNASLFFLKRFSSSIIENQYSGWVIWSSREILDWLPSDLSPVIVGCAVDLGTTTIALELVDLKSGETLYRGVDANAQVKFGDDVISRISFASISDKNLEELKNSLIFTVNNLLQTGLSVLGFSKNSIYEVVLVGNTTMMHLLLGISPKSLGEMPFVPVFTSPITLKSSELGIAVNPNSEIYTLPSIGGFIGSDITAGLLALDLFTTNENFLFLDLGTNGEIVVGTKGRILATSTATGPAFEGGRLSCGMRADKGAIDHIFLSDEDVSFTVIDNSIPKGICGSGVIELISLLLELKILDSNGKFHFSSLSPNIPKKVLERIVVKDGEPAIIIYRGNSDGEKIYFSARDVRQFQLACGAVKCGVKLLLSHLGVLPENIDSVYIAGNFASYINPKHLVRVGIIPPHIPHNKIHVVGNTSLLGAKMALLDMEKRRLAEEQVGSIEHIDLATFPNFEEEFIFSIFFPEFPET